MLSSGHVGSIVWRVTRYDVFPSDDLWFSLDGNGNWAFIYYVYLDVYLYNTETVKGNSIVTRATFFY